MLVKKNIIKFIGKYMDIFEPKYGVFKTSDYNLNLEERRSKYEKYKFILCKTCSNDIYIEDCYCTSCYDKETDLVKKGHMKFGPKFEFFETLDYNLDLEERRKKNVYITSDYNLDLEERRKMYMNYDNILCEECSNEINMQQKWNYNNKKINFIEIAYMKKYEYENEKYSNEIDEWNYYCIYCYDKETDIIKKGHIKFGSNFRILDCNLNLEERRIKYMNLDGILCEKCNQEINNHYYYCMSCHYKETDIIKKSHMESNFGILDCYLNLKERKAKYEKYNLILCEKCNNEIFKWNYYCTPCYNKETNVIEKGHIKFGSNFGILDYNLNLKKRRIKYMNFDGILCGKCNKEIDNQCYYCTACYNKETDLIKKGLMKFESNLEIFKKSDYNLNLEERRAKYMNYDETADAIKKGHMKFGSNFEIFNTFDYNLNLKERRVKYMNYDETDAIKKGHMKFGSNFEIFNTFDYNLNLKERMRKYMNYDCILCEKCSNEIDKQYYNCNNCYNNQMIINKCKVCFIGNNDNCCSFYEFKQYLENFSKWINENNVFKTSKVGISDYDLDEDDRRVKYKNFDYILCKKCDRKYHYNYCYECFDEKIREFSPKLQDYENFYFKVYKKETNELRELKELQSILIDYKNIYFKLNSNLGIFKQIIQKFENTKYYVLDKKILIDNIRYNGVHNCWRKLRSYCCNCYDREIDIIEKKRMEFGKCKECLKIHEDLDATYMSRPLNFQNLPEPINCTDQQEFISSRYTKRIRTGQVNTIYSDECLDCIIMDKD
ncbi:14583_t:CDS:2 [Rhizophagus irregularis]|nr:14583_t:CDS:2 [Rhizophagus irregularis]